MVVWFSLLTFVWDKLPSGDRFIFAYFLTTFRLMKTKFFLFLFLVTLTPLFVACSDDDNDDAATNPDDTTGTQSDNAYVNNWTYEKMDEWYLWRDEMPNKTSLNFESDPETFFSSLLYSNEWPKHPEYSFSRIESSHDDLLKTASLATSTTTSSIGFEYIATLTGITSYPVAFIVSFVYPQTDAKAKGLKRGDVIFTINKTAITQSNYSTILSGSSSYTFYINNYGDNKNFDLTVTPTSNYEESPILADSIYTVGSHTIGYLAYNSFTPKDLIDREYDVQLLNILTNFRSKGVTDVVLDLRYNGGGYLSSAQALASALVPNLNSSNIMDIMNYNSVKQAEFDKLSDNNATKISYMYDYFATEISSSSGKKLADVPKLGSQLNNLYIIGTEETASASELIINALKPYYSEASKTLKVVGETTVGKNVGSFAIYEDDDDRNSYVLWPISFKIYNKNKESDYSNGFTPDIVLDEFDYLTVANVGWKELGDKNEVLLNAAIADITGTTTAKSAVLRSSSVLSLKVLGSSNDKKVLNKKLIHLRSIDSL